MVCVCVARCRVDGGVRTLSLLISSVLYDRISGEGCGSSVVLLMRSKSSILG